MAHNIAKFRRSSCKNFAAKCTFKLLKPSVQDHQRSGIKIFFCGAVLEDR